MKTPYEVTIKATIIKRFSINATEPQKTCYTRLVQRYACAPSHIYKAFHTKTLICEWPFITIGIEPDGYAHS